MHGALLPETLVAVEDGSLAKARAHVSIEAGELVLDIEADDLASLRAAVNSHMRWVDAASKAAAIGK